MITPVRTGEVVKAWRERARRTQQELADEAGYRARSVVADFEAGRSAQTVTTLLRLIAAIERSLDYAFPETENERLARFFLGPSVMDGTLLVVHRTYRPGTRKRQAKAGEPDESAARRLR